MSRKYLALVPVVLLLTLSAVIAEETAATSDSSQSPSAPSSSKEREPGYHPVILNMLAKNNQLRAARGMRPLRISSRLTAAAQNHARYMASTGSFSHYSNGSPAGRAAAYGYRSGVRENIAMGQGSVQGAFAVWSASGAHNANLLSQSSVAGFGYAVGRNGMPYWVAVYGPEDGVKD